MSGPDTLPAPDVLPHEIAAGLARVSERLGPFGRQVHWYAELPSTNDAASVLAERGAPEGALVMADAQTAGRGRRGRAWHSPAGAGLYVSVLLRLRPSVLPLLTLAAGVALAEGIRASTGLAVALKWPNDVVVPPGAQGSPRKLAGILAEGGPSHVVVGFGINVISADYPADVAERATSLARELGRFVDRGAVIGECLAALATRYDDLNAGRSAAVLDAWREHARPMLAKSVEWEERETIRHGMAHDVDPSGALIVRTDDGDVRVISGEVRWTQTP